MIAWRWKGWNPWLAHSSPTAIRSRVRGTGVGIGGRVIPVFGSAVVEETVAEFVGEPRVEAGTV